MQAHASPSKPRQAHARPGKQVLLFTLLTCQLPQALEVVQLASFVPGFINRQIIILLLSIAKDRPALERVGGGTADEHCHRDEMGWDAGGAATTSTVHTIKSTVPSSSNLG